jgi:integrase
MTIKPILRGKSYSIQARINGKQYWQSLGTRDPDEANNVHRLSEARRKIEDRAAKKSVAAQNVAPAKALVLTIEEVCARYRLHLLEREKAKRQSDYQPKFVETEHQQIFADKYGLVGLNGDLVKLVSGWHTRLTADLARTRAHLVLRDTTTAGFFYDQLAADTALCLPERSQCLPRLMKTRVAALLEILDDDSASAAPDEAQKKSNAPLLSAVTQAFIAESKPSPDTKFDIEVVTRDLISIVGDRPIDDYGRKDMVAYKEVIATLAANWHKKKQLRHLSIVEAAKKSKELGLEPRAQKTEELRYGILRRVFAHAKEHYDGVQNPFEAKLSVASGKKKLQAANQRQSFGRQRLFRLVNAPQLRNDPNDGDRYYWFTWLAICSGMRLGEICQLRTQHVLRAPDRIYLSPELNLKEDKDGGEQCIRSIPLHPKLIQLGFLDFVATRPAGASLWEGKLPKHASGRLSDTPSKKYGRLLKAIGLKEARLSFHSLRHDFGAEWKRKHPMAVEPRERLMGHTLEAGQTGRYGDDFQSEALDMELLKSRADLLRALDFDVDKKPSVSTTQADLFAEG